MFSLRNLGLVALAAVALLVLIPPPALVTAPGTPPFDAEIFNRLETQLMSALRDHDARSLEELLADDYELTSIEVTGGRIGKIGYVERVLGPEIPKLDRFRFRSLSTIPLSDDLVMVKLDVEWHTAGSWAPSELRYLVTDVWRLRAGQWRLLSRHSTPAR